MAEKSGSQNPSEPVKRRPEPTPAPPLLELTTPGAKVLLEAIRIRGVAITRILARVECIPCMSEDCDGPEVDVPDARDGLSATRCDRCAAVRLAMSVVHGEGV